MRPWSRRSGTALEVLTTDALVEGVHFDRRFMPPAAIGHKALAVNLSDLAAMGAAPRAGAAVAGAAWRLPSPTSTRWSTASWRSPPRYGVALVGGNISRSPGPLVVDVTAIGSGEAAARAARAAGARPGDGIYVSGTVGAAAAGRLRAPAHGESPATG